MQCRVTNSTILELCSMTKEEQVEEVLEVMVEMQDLVEVQDKLFVTTVELLDTTHEILLILPLHVSIVILMIILLSLRS